MNLAVNVVTDRPDVFGDSYVSRTVSLTHPAQKAGEDGFRLFEHLVFEPQHDVSEKLPRHDVKANGTQSRTGTAIHACRGVECPGAAEFFYETGIDFTHYLFSFIVFIREWVVPVLAGAAEADLE